MKDIYKKYGTIEEIAKLMDTPQWDVLISKMTIAERSELSIDLSIREISAKLKNPTIKNDFELMETYYDMRKMAEELGELNVEEDHERLYDILAEKAKNVSYYVNENGELVMKYNKI